MYINERIKDIEDIQNGITVEHVVLYDKGSLAVMDQLGNLSVINNEEDITVVFVEWKLGTIPMFYVLGKYCQCLLMIVKIWVFFGRIVSH